MRIYDDAIITLISIGFILRGKCHYIFKMLKVSIRRSVSRYKNCGCIFSIMYTYI